MIVSRQPYEKFNRTKFDYSLNKASLTRHNKCKDLGVEFQSNLRFSDHYNSIINKAYRALGFVIRNSKHFKKIDSVVRLFNCLVRPHLEYAAVIWSPQTEVNINHIEKVQKRFLRYLYVRKYNEYPFLVSYKSMLTSFKIQSLYDRRCMQSVLLIYNIVNSLKYKSSFLINYVNFYVPKINLRLQNNNIFSCNNVSNSPINNMQLDCNRFIERHNIDLFACQLGVIRSLFSA